MSLTAYLYQTPKRVNSTLIPTMVSGDIGVPVELKDVTNLFNPTLVLTDAIFNSGGQLTNPLHFVHCYISDFDRYYFIRSWSWVLGRWEASLELDVLASHKTEIGNATALVLRAYSEYDANLIDTKYVTRSECVSSVTTQSSIWHTNINSTAITDGFYVVGIVNNDSGAVGAVSYYAVAGSVLHSFMSQLYASPSWMNITDSSISTDLQKMLINPIQYVVSCMYFPLSLQISGVSWTTISTIPVGWWDITLTGGAVFYKLDNVKLQHDSSLELAIPKHVDATGAYKWLQNSPYSQYQLEFFPFGVFTLDSAKLYDFDKIRCEIKVDLMTGSGTMNVIRKKSGSNYSGILFTVTSQIGIPISMAQMSVDLGKLANGSNWALAAGLGIVTTDSSVMQETKDAGAGVLSSVAGGIKDVLANPRAISSTIREAVSSVGSSVSDFISSAGKIAANIGNALLASSGVCQMTGSTGTLAQYYFNQTLTLWYYRLTDVDPEHYGYPLGKTRRIGNLSGFVLCANEGDLSVNGNIDERTAVVTAMKNGFYYE